VVKSRQRLRGAGDNCRIKAEEKTTERSNGRRFCQILVQWFDLVSRPDCTPFGGQWPATSKARLFGYAQGRPEIGDWSQK
jgi:hypothetical protein